MTERKSSAHFPGDLFTLLVFPVIVIAFAVAGFRYSWLVMFSMGASELWLGTVALRHRFASPAGWLMLLLGVGMLAAAAFMFFAPLRVRTI
jgi:hypothetical protein